LGRGLAGCSAADLKARMQITSRYFISVLPLSSGSALANEPRQNSLSWRVRAASSRDGPRQLVAGHLANAAKVVRRRVSQRGPRGRSCSLIERRREIAGEDERSRSRMTLARNAPSRISGQSRSVLGSRGVISGKRYGFIARCCRCKSGAALATFACTPKRIKIHRVAEAPLVFARKELPAVRLA